MTIDTAEASGAASPISNSVAHDVRLNSQATGTRTRKVESRLFDIENAACPQPLKKPLRQNMKQTRTQ